MLRVVAVPQENLWRNLVFFEQDICWYTPHSPEKVWAKGHLHVYETRYTYKKPLLTGRVSWSRSRTQRTIIMK